MAQMERPLATKWLRAGLHVEVSRRGLTATETCLLLSWNRQTATVRRPYGVTDTVPRHHVFAPASWTGRR